jgi:hypothetical protein
MPLAELKRHLAEFPEGREMVAYCRPLYCVLSFQAAAARRARGQVLVEYEVAGCRTMANEG